MCHARRISSLLRYSYVLCQFLKYMTNSTSNKCSGRVQPLFQEQLYCGYPDVGGCQCRNKQAVRIQCVRRPMICMFGVSTFKGLLSIPCDRRGARRPQGQTCRLCLRLPPYCWIGSRISSLKITCSPLAVRPPCRISPAFVSSNCFAIIEDRLASPPIFRIPTA